MHHIMLLLLLINAFIAYVVFMCMCMYNTCMYVTYEVYIIYNVDWDVLCDVIRTYCRHS